jgi:glycine dehydrogenase subunit 2
MKDSAGATGLVFNEPLLWEIGSRGRTGFSLPKRDVDPSEVDPELKGDGPDFPDLSELEVVRHFTRLSQWNFGVDSGMYPLGSCTMKYNPKTNERQAGLPGWAGAHPLLPASLCQGAFMMMFELERCLAEITGLAAVTLQPAAGSHGELTGMMMIQAYHKSKGNPRSKVLIPDTAHGTNPASAALCGFRAVAVPSNEQGILDPRSIARFMDEDTAGMMITNPNTLGLFESHIIEIADIVHAKGGLVYGDGANMNAIMGMVDFAKAGVDVLHLNLHKTFSTPHGGGGPGSGPVCVTDQIEPFLPVPRVVKSHGRYELCENYPQSIGKIHAFYGNFGVLVKAYSYIMSLGPDLKKVSRLAVLNANYIKESLKEIFHLPYDRPCMHECVFSDKFQQDKNVTTLDMAKRLMEYGYHPPTIYFPLVVPGAMMIEPTETESKQEIDRFIQAAHAIAGEVERKPQLLQEAPLKTKVRRLDETGAARHPRLAG